MVIEDSIRFCVFESLNTTMVDEGGNNTVRVANFLKPCAKNTGEATRFPTVSSPPRNGEEVHPAVQFKGWKNPQRKWNDWIEIMAGKYGFMWNQTGICDAILSSMYKIQCNQSLILGIVEYWCIETNTFVFPWGEATITLEDVMVLGGFSVLGEPVNLPLTGDMVAMEAEMLRLSREMDGGKSRRDQRTWMKFFMEEGQSHDLEHVGFLSLWLSRFVFPSLPYEVIATRVFPIAIRLARGTKLALAPAVLAGIYESLRLLKQQVTSSLGESVKALGLFQLVQLWANERFSIFGSNCPIELKPGEPRAARWHGVISNANGCPISSALKFARSFQWRPYAADLKNWCFVSPYKDNEQFVHVASNSNDELKSFGQCLFANELVGLGGCIEKYMPYRVAMQFGFDQHLPGDFAYLNWWRASKVNQEKQEGEINGMRLNLKDDEPSQIDRIKNVVGDFAGLLSDEKGRVKLAKGTLCNPLDVEAYACSIVGTLSHPIDVDKYWCIYERNRMVSKASKELETSLQNLDLNPQSNVKNKISIATNHHQFQGLLPKKMKPPSLVSLCIGVIGKHLEDIITDLPEIAIGLPAEIKTAVAAIARRRKLLNDDVLIALADTSWEYLDVSGSDVSDVGLIKAAEVCRSIKALDISRCTKITATGISELVKHCRLLETLRCGGCPRSDHTARRCLSIFKPRLDYVEEDSWEELDTKEISSGAQSLRWLVWPNIDNNSLDEISTECPRIIVNLKSSPFGLWELSEARFALSFNLPELSVAEKFRLAFEERDNRLAPKRAKNARQHQRRAVRELMLMSTRAKAMVLASQASKSLHSRSS
ncbi:uncharacterized protein DS421_9g281790 [Arachis hypogaea]|nr:uncharacterized protein DS421_9g281790 [Arachis hypogaea]